MPPASSAETARLNRCLGVDAFLSLMRAAISAFVILGLLMFIGQQIDPDNFVAARINPDATGLTAAQFEGLVISGLSQGAMYGLVALGYSMVYGVLGFINFAHGEVFMVGAMTGMITSNKLDESGAWESNFAVSLLFVLAVAIICSTLTAIIMERAVAGFAAAHPTDHLHRCVVLHSERLGGAVGTGCQVLPDAPKLAVEETRTIRVHHD